MLHYTQQRSSVYEQLAASVCTSGTSVRECRNHLSTCVCVCRFCSRTLSLCRGLLLVRGHSMCSAQCRLATRLLRGRGKHTPPASRPGCSGGAARHERSRTSNTAEVFQRPPLSHPHAKGLGGQGKWLVCDACKAPSQKRPQHVGYHPDEAATPAWHRNNGPSQRRPINHKVEPPAVI